MPTNKLGSEILLSEVRNRYWYPLLKTAILIFALGLILGIIFYFILDIDFMFLALAVLDLPLVLVSWWLLKQGKLVASRNVLIITAQVMMVIHSVLIPDEFGAYFAIMPLGMSMFFFYEHHENSMFNTLIWFNNLFLAVIILFDPFHAWNLNIPVTPEASLTRNWILVFSIMSSFLILIVIRRYTNFYIIHLLNSLDERDKVNSIISHDLRSPVNAAKGVGMLLAMEIDGGEKPDTKQIGEMVGMMNLSLDKALLTINDVLDQYRFKVEKIRLKEVSVGKALAQLVESLQVASRNKNIDLKLTLPREEITWPLNETKIDRLMRNLLTNAIKFSRPGGKVEISSAVDGDLIIIVRDYGIGMPPKMVESIFGVSSGNQRRGTAGEKSTGLGMKICKEIVDYHRGEIIIDSEVGKGTVVKVTIPKVNP
ncbi:MAG: HAMP domain-containing histidine kinase [Cyclobacteriaceae bacterium]|nr:HAMP domain-containing histidine kinase [Cyclobacteriaceae bacterium]